METISKQIERLETERAAEWQKANTILETAQAAEDGEGRDLDADEQAAFESIMDPIEKDPETGRPVAGTGGTIARLDERIAKLKAIESAGFRSKAVTRLSSKGDPLVDVKPKDRPKGTFPAALAQYLFKGQGNRTVAAQIARQDDDHLAAFALETPPDVLERASTQLFTGAAVPAGTVGDADFAAKLVRIRQLNEQFREWWWPKSIVGRLSLTRLSFEGDGSIKVPSDDAASIGYWVAEAGPIPAESMTIGEITLTPYKMGVISVVTNELLRRSTPQILSILTDKLATGVARTIDARFIGVAAASGGAPAGLFAGVTPIDATAHGTDLAGVETTAKAMIAVLAAADAPAGGWAWVMRETQRNHIKFLLNSLGIPAYREEINQGMWLGYDNVESNSSTASGLHLIAAPQVFWADELMPTIALSDSAAVELNDAPVGDGTGLTSLFQKDMMGVRLTTAVDWKATRLAARAIALNVAW